MTRLSLPREHGGSLTVAAAAIVAAALAPAPAAAIGVALAVAAAFFARGPIDRAAARVALREWDVPWLALLGVFLAAGMVLSAVRSAWLAAATLALCAVMVVGSALARTARLQRSILLEVLGMSALGGSAGLALVAAGASPSLSATAAIVLAVHAGISVPLVRSELRRRERAAGRRSVGIAALAVLGGAALVVALGHPFGALALGPRAAHLAVRAAGEPPGSAARSALRESLLLCACVLVLLATR
jgi:hypothetical protein